MNILWEGVGGLLVYHCVVELATFGWKGNNSSYICKADQMTDIIAFQGIVQQNLLVFVFTHWPGLHT